MKEMKMKLKYYVIFSLVFLAITFLIVFAITQEEYNLGFGSLPIALWFCIVVGLFFVCSIVFFMADWLKEKFAQRNNQKDFDIIIDQIISQDPDQKNLSKIKNAYFAKFSKILQRYELKPKLDTPDSTTSKIDKVFNIYKNIKNGVQEDLHKISSKHTEYERLNDCNYASKGNKNALEILKNTSKPLEVRQFAFHVICESKKDKDIFKALSYVQDCLNKDLVYIIANQLTELKLESSQISEYCKQVGFECDDYVKLAQNLHTKLSPDEWLKLFADLAHLDEKAQKAYIYVLLELEMISQATDELKSNQNDELLGLRAYIDLKKAGKNYPLELFTC